ncbi:MAG: hypothetical protein LBG87_01895 [Spirochaetaceae bacterium]|jgi:hypothetical protein|nr:hypothetical protein [Spirochaetaceae bacterium]
MKNIIEEKNAGVGMHIISKQTASGIYMFPVKNGLLQKANQFKSKRPPETEHKVITDDDFQQVQTQIDEIIRNNRLATQSKKPTVFRKRELTLPLAVNGFMMVLTAGILLSIAVAVNKQESDEAQSGEAFSSVEGQLLQRLRQESEYRLSEKDRELEEARKLLAELEYEHGNIVQKQEIQYRDREEEYRRLLAQDVSAERQRLIAAGVPMSELNSILAVYEKERFAYYQDALAKYREQLDEERRVAEENYRRLQKKYQDSIKAISEERQSIQNELREKENAFRIGSEDQSGQPQQNAADAEKTAEARKTLTELEAQRRQNNLEESRITGMFNNLRVALQQSRYQDAVNQSESLIRYLEGSARDTPERQERRNLDRYLADALAQIARNEMYKASDQNPEAVALRGRITALEQENARLARLNSELSQALDAARRREDEIEALTARLSQNERELATLSARITQLEQENARLTRANQELSQGAEQNRRNQAESASLSARITQLEQENARLTRANQELSQGAEQNQRNQAESASHSARITQ